MATEFKLSYTANQIDSKLQQIDSKANISDIPTKVSELDNDIGYITSAPVTSVNGKTGDVTVSVPTKVSQLTNDINYITSYTETDPTVPAWAKEATKPSYSKSEVGLGNVDNVKQYSASNPPPYPVTKVNNKTGAVTLTASDVGADASGTANSAVSAHNTNTSAHADIREAINQLSSEIVDIKHLPFENKKIVAIGDSIVAGSGDGAGGFLQALKTKYPSITIENMGVGSTTFALNNNVPMNKTSGCIFSRIDNIPADADYIILEGGLNDFFHKDTYSVKFGSYVENLHKYPVSAKYENGAYSGLYYGAEYGGVSSQVFYQDTFCGAFEMSLIKIITRFHDKKCALLIPHNPTGSAELEKYLDAEARICKKYNFPCIDLRLSAVMPRIYTVAGNSSGSAYTDDGVHPNMAGYESQYLPAIERWLIDGSFESSVGACTKAEVETLINDMNSPVSSVNGKTGNVIITAVDLGAVPESKKITITVNDSDGTARTYELYGVEVSSGGNSGGDGDDNGGSTNTPTNLVPTSIDSDGSILNGKGYVDGYRLSTSKGTPSEQTNATTTGFIQAVGGNVFEISGLKWWDTTQGYNVIAAYDSNFNYIGCVTSQGGGSVFVKTIYSSLTGDNTKTTVKIIEGLNIAYIRVSFYASSSITGASAVIVRN